MFDSDQPKELYQQAAARLNDQAVALFLVQPGSPVVSTKGLNIPTSTVSPRYYLDLGWS